MCSLISQNRDFTVSIALGAGNSGFQINQPSMDKLSRIYYPMGGIHIQKSISEKFALNFFPNVGLSGIKRILAEPRGDFTESRSTSAFVNLAIHPKYFLSNGLYVSVGPELSYLLWNYGSIYNGEQRLSHLEETEYFSRVNLLLSASVGISTKISESRKNAPVEIDALWFLEFRTKKVLTNILKRNVFGNTSSSILSFELVTGISFASKN